MTFYKFARIITGWIIAFWFKVKYVGINNIPLNSGYIVASNHVSVLDPIFLAQKIKTQIFFLAKSELFAKPLLGPILRKLNVFSVQRGSTGFGAVDYSVKTINEGKVLGIFPEGTRSKTGELLKARSGTTIIAARTGADILPVGITYTKRLRFRSTIIVRFGTPIKNSLLSNANNGPREIKEANRLIMSTIGTLLETGKM